MLSRLLAENEVGIGNLILTPIFFFAFLLLIGWVFSKKRVQFYKDVSELPLKENELGVKSGKR